MIQTELKTGLILSGGGARAAYQVGVLKAISDLHGRKAKNPFSVISGTSAGAINAVGLAASSNNFLLAVKKIEKMWSELRVHDVYKAEFGDLFLSICRLTASLFNQGVGQTKPLALFDNSPLRELLISNIQYRNIQKRIEAGFLDAVSVTASGYESGESVTFFQAKQDITGWKTARRVGLATKLSERHLLASSAIPAILPAEKIHREYFGDGALRQLSPISPALRMGADRVLVIGVRGPKNPKERIKSTSSPSLAQMTGHVFNSAFIDSLEHDIEMTKRQNHLLEQIENQSLTTKAGKTLKPIDILVIQPSVEFNNIAVKHLKSLNPSLRMAMRMVGANRSSSALASFLLFEGKFCKELIRIGYQDAMKKSSEIRIFFNL